VSKSCADQIAFSYFHTHRVPVAFTRCGNLFGPGDLNCNRLIPGTIRSALRDESPIIRSDGTFVRDYFFVRDAVDAYLTLAERVPEMAGEAFNFGAERPLSVIQVVDVILELMGKKHLAPTILDEATHEIPAQYLDCTKARQRLSWKPPRTLEQGLGETIEWYRSHL
jgi:CDP-glucose 4,6-dehydratase